MKSKVFFVPVKDAENIRTVNSQLKKLIEKSKVLDVLNKGQKVGVKVHFGEEGNTGYVRPQHLRVICDAITLKNTTPILSDANTLYRGKRLNSKDHLEIAHQHGFTKKAVGADIFIPDDGKKEEITEVQINQKQIQTAKVGKFFIDADAIVGVSHFKGHILTGFGGAIKTIGMGCATREGKLAQHCDVSPMLYVDQCTGCGECELVCPVKAIQIENGKSQLDKTKCIGCASCVAACPSLAMFIDFEAGDAVQDKMAEYSLAVLKNKKGKACFINFALRINQECDCWGMKNPRIAPDVGILASLDPVAIDHASYDVVNRVCRKDIFKETHPKPDGLRQLRYAQEIGIGNMDYELIKV
jgi:uncharacterized Fe-S center protein